MAEDLRIEQSAANSILNNGVRYTLGKEKITIRPLFFGTTLSICKRICEAGLSQETIEKGETNPVDFFAEYGEVALECVAMAELNKKEDLTEKKIKDRADWYTYHLTAGQIYELFAFVLQLSSIQAFPSTISLLWMMKKSSLSPNKREGS
ncbi:hypothetical protein FACS1894162_3660 [Bacteroidia bacterium]|nr:hypothetical protein FACS1894162_3660 [Bacteroidia bacterium]